MKTNRIMLKNGGLLPMIMAALMLLTLMGCEKDSPVYPEQSLEIDPENTGYVESQTIKVLPEGTEVSVFEGSVLLSFPEGTVQAPTLFIIYSFPTNQHDFDGINMYSRGLFLEGDTPDQKLSEVSIQVKYDLAPESWKRNVPDEKAEQNLTIYHVSPDVNLYQHINALHNCCVDCECKMIKGYINSCGFYVVGEN